MSRFLARNSSALRSGTISSRVSGKCHLNSVHRRLGAARSRAGSRGCPMPGSASRDRGRRTASPGVLLRSRLRVRDSIRVTEPQTTAVLKFGGEVVAAPEQLATMLSEVAELVDSGWRFVVCHGGGPQATELGRRIGLEPRKVAGQRVTDAETLRVVCQVLAGEVSCTVVAAARAAGLRALGISA